MCLVLVCFAWWSGVAILPVTPVPVWGAQSDRSGVEQPRPGDHPVLQQMEQQLAGSQELYLVLDLASRQAVLKARGVPVRTFPVLRESRVGGLGDRAHMYGLIRKRPETTPPLTTPEPGDTGGAHEPVEAEGTGETTAIIRTVLSELEREASDAPLVVSAMPARYELIFADDLSIIVYSARTTSTLGRLLDRVANVSYGLSVQIRAFAGRLWGASHSYVLLEMTPEEAQAFYWALVPPFHLLLLTEAATGEAS